MNAVIEEVLTDMVHISFLAIIISLIHLLKTRKGNIR